MDKIDAFLNNIQRKFPGEKTPGYHCILLRGGRVEFERSFGFANLETETLISGKTIFHLGSETKQFTAFLVMLLVQDGLLNPDDDVRSIVPYWQCFPHELRVSDLLRHTSGIPDYISKNLEVLSADGKALPGFVGGRNYFGSAIVKNAIKDRAFLQLPPPFVYSYSNSNYVILADVVEAIAGDDFAKVAKTRIFDPLGMNETFFDTQRSKVVRGRATSYSADLLELGLYHTRFKNFDVIGDVGLMTNAHDLVRWEENFWNDRLGGIASMLTFPGVPGDEGSIYGCGLWFGQIDGTQYIAHGGRMDGFKSIILRLPSFRVSFIYLANSDIPFLSSEAIGREIASLFNR